MLVVSVLATGLVKIGFIGTGSKCEDQAIAKTSIATPYCHNIFWPMIAKIEPEDAIYPAWIYRPENSSNYFQVRFLKCME